MSAIYMTIAQQIDLLVESMISIPASKRYWLIRTQAGTLYDDFLKNDFIALEHSEISLNFLNKIKDFNSNQKSESIKTFIKDYYHKKETSNLDDAMSQRQTSLIASQIYKFVYELKKGDTVVIPSYNSDLISFGIVTESFIADAAKAKNSYVLDQYFLKRR